MKKCGVLILTFLMIFSFCSGFAEATPEEYENAAENKIFINASSFVESGVKEPNIYYGQSSKTEYMSTDKRVLVFSGSNAMFGYDVPIEKSGTYEVVAYIASTTKLTVSLLLNGEEKGRGNLNAQPSYSHYMPVNLGMLDLEEGTSRIGIKNYSGDGAQFVYLTVECVAGNLEASAVYANQTKISDTREVSAATDAFTLFFNHKLHKETVESIAFQDKNGGDIASEIKLFDKKAEINLKEALREETEYTISVGYAEDFLGKSCIRDFSYDLTAKKGEPVGGGTITLDYVSSEYEIIRAAGSVTSSKGLPIQNKLIFADVSGTEKAAETTSDEDGKFTLTYTLPEGSDSGEVTLSVYSDHYEQKAEQTVLYVSQGLEAKVLSAVETAATAEEVGRILAENEKNLGIHIKLDTLPVSDKNLVYRHMVQTRYKTIADLLLAYYSYAGMEDINCAATARHINAVLSNANICAALEIETEKVNALSSTHKAEFNKTLIDWPEEFTDIDSVKKALKDTIQKFMLTEFEKTNVSFTGNTFSVYVGEVIEHAVSFVMAADGVKNLSVLLKADDPEILKNSEFVNSSELACKTELSGGLMILSFESDGTKFVQKLGTLKLRTASAGGYTIKQSGTISYDVGKGFLIDDVIGESDISVSVSKNEPSKGSGGGSSTSTPSSRPTYQDVTQRPPEKKEPTPEKFAFSDMEKHVWAKEAVEELLKLGIISESADTSFRPSDNITREEFVKLVICALHKETTENTSDFSDVPKDAWYYAYISTAKALGIVEGDGEKFGTGTFITREDMATMLYRAVSGTLRFDGESTAFADDEQISDYAKAAVYQMRDNRIINGAGDNMFMPKQNATRAESAKMIYELIKAVK